MNDNHAYFATVVTYWALEYTTSSQIQPWESHFGQVESLTLQYLQDYLQNHFGGIADTNFISFSGSATGIAFLPERIGFEGEATFSSTSTAVPTRHDLDTVLATSFQAPAVQALLTILQQLPAENPFSTTCAISFCKDPERIVLSPWALQYTTPYTTSSQPWESHFGQVESLTLQYLQDYLRNHFGGIADTSFISFSGSATGFAFRPERIGFKGKVIFSSTSTAVPTRQDLDTVLATSFQAPAVQALLTILQQLPAENPFSTTYAISFSSDSGAHTTKDADREEGRTKPIRHHGSLFGATNPTAAGGTRIAPYQVTSRQDGTNSITLQSISAMPQYENKSHEELRTEDYLQENRGTAAQSSTTSGFAMLGSQAMTVMPNYAQKLEKRVKELEETLRVFKTQKADAGSKEPSDVIHLNVCGTYMAVLRRTLTLVPDSMLAARFSGLWDESIEKDSDGKFFVNQPIELFKPMIDYLISRENETPLSKKASPPSVTSFGGSLERYEAFLRMVEYYGMTPGIYRFEIRSFGQVPAKIFSDFSIETSDDYLFGLVPIGHDRKVCCFEVSYEEIVSQDDSKGCHLGWVHLNHQTGTWGTSGYSVGVDFTHSTLKIANGSRALERLQFTEDSVFRCEDKDGDLNWYIDGVQIKNATCKKTSLYDPIVPGFSGKAKWNFTKIELWP